MKKLLILIALMAPFALAGQNAWDAMRYSRLITRERHALLHWVMP